MMYTIFFFNDTATTEIYTLSLHDALPICDQSDSVSSLLLSLLPPCRPPCPRAYDCTVASGSVSSYQALYARGVRSEEHTSELQSRQYLVCRLLLEKKTVSHLPRIALYSTD